MVGGFFPGARLAVDPGAEAAGDEGFGDPDVIDPEPRKWEKPSDHAPVITEFDS